MGLKPTPEQKAIFKFIHKSKKNLLIVARAGTGKTTTIISALRFLPKNGSSIIFLAFNKHIQKELELKLPEHVRCRTLHSVGFGAVKRKYPNIEFDEFKLDHILKRKSKNWKLDQEYKDYQQRMEYLKDLKSFINVCRLTMTTDPKYIPYLAKRYEFRYRSQKDLKRIRSVLEFLISDRKKMDFTDMVFLPAIDDKIWLFPQDYIIVDEAQDISRAQQFMIRKMLKKTGRLISVGDEKQAIYSFAGADSNSFEWFRKFPKTEVLPLTTTFRCAKKIVEHANSIVPDIKPLENAPDGVVREGCVLTEPSDGDFVLCRTTTPLVVLFFQYLSEGKKASIMGSDIGKSVIEMTNGFTDVKKMMLNWTNKLEEFSVELIKSGILNYKEHSGYIALEDKVNVVNFIGKVSKTIDDFKNKINIIFSDEVHGIVLSTIHKAKGLEADRVFIARPDKIPLPTSSGIQHLQEKNLEYVAITRAKKELIYDYKWTDE